MEASDLYLRGRYFWNQLYYQRATERDPEYALAWSGMADAYSASPINADQSPIQVWPLVRDAVAHATASGFNLPEVQNSLGLFKFWLDWDWVAAEAAFRKSIALDPSYSLAHRFLGIVLSHMARHEEAALAIRQARDLDPFNATNHALSAQAAFAAHDYSGAVQFAEQAIAIDPEFWIGYIQLAQVYEQLGNTDLALNALKNAGRFSGGNSKAIALRGYICAKLGRTKEAHEVLSTLEAVSREGYVPPYETALVPVGSANTIRPWTGWNGPTTRTTCIGSLLQWIQNGILCEPMSVSLISLGAAALQHGHSRHGEKRKAA